MKTVNALTRRNNLGSVLDTLEKTKEPILISKGRIIRAVLITPDDFRRRFVDRQAEEEKQRLLGKIKSLSSGRVGKEDSVEVLRELRGYKQ